jgi:membrane-associated phospholipid phosphatase
MRSAVSEIGGGSLGVLRRHLLLAGLVGLYGLIGALLSRHFGLAVETTKVGVLVTHFLTKVPQIIFFVLFWRLIHHSYIARAPDRLAALKADVQGFLSNRDQLLGGAMATVLMAVVLLVFAQTKSLVPIIQPFAWDPFLADLDRLLHFGTDPYVIAHAVFGSQPSLTFFTGLYNIWLLLVYLALFGACFIRPDSVARMQFLVAFLLAWAIGGNLMATIFSSAGPVYFALLGFGETFVPLIDLLNVHTATGALSVTETQKLLWDFYTAPQSINAISAFPSMHVTSTVLISIFAFQISRWMGWAMTAFALCIQIGSVLLGWHYAVDGYAGAVIAVLSWKAAGFLVRRFGGFATITR